MINKKYRVIIADDHSLFRQGLRLILMELNDIEVIADVPNGKELVEIAGILEPDLIIMDINMPFLSGIEASKILARDHPEIKILVVSMYGDEQYYNSVIENGVKGFILKDADNSELKTAVRDILNGKTYFSQELLYHVIQKIKHRENENKTSNLSKREKEILLNICEGYSNQEIANSLFISKRTVDKHRANLLGKTNTNNTASLILFAIRNKLIKI